MNSIPHSHQANTSHRSSHSKTPPYSTPDAAADQVRGFFYNARSAVTSGDYLLRKWLPLLGPELFTLIKVLRSMCYFNPETGELREECWPTYETLAARCGVSRATIARWLKRDASGQFVWKQTSEAGQTEWVSSPLNGFIRLVRRRTRYSPQHQSRVQTSNLYLVALDDPLLPEDVEALKEREAELEVLEAVTVNTSPPGQGMTGRDSESQNETRRAVSKRDSQSRLILRRKELLRSNSLNIEIERTKGERPLVSEEGQTAEDDVTASPPKKTLVGGLGAKSSSAECTTRASGCAAQRSAQPSVTAPLKVKDPALSAAVQQTGGVLASLLQEEFGASNPVGGALTILEALVEVHAPLDTLVDLASLGRKRLRQQLALGNPIQNQAGYYITLMRDLAREALVKGWDVAQLAQEDDAKYAPAKRRAARAGQEAQEPEEAEAPSAASTHEEAASSKNEEAADPAMAPAPLPPDLPKGVERLDAPAVAALYDTLPDPDTGQPRALSMLWGFVRQALCEQQLSLARRQHLDNLTPKWGEGRPRTLLLLCSTTYTARFVAQVLRRDIQQQLDKRLYPYFDDIQVVFAPAQEGER